MIDTQRIIYSDNGVLADSSLALCEYMAGDKTIAMVTGEDYIYIGSIVPFNHLYIDVKTANTTTSSLTIEVYNNNVWESCVDILDNTSVGGKTLSQSGIVQFALDYLKGWSYESYSNDIPELAGSKLYDMHWLRIGVSASLSLTTTINYIGHRFCTANDLYSLYPLLNNAGLLEAYKTGKTSWDEQILIASEFIIRDLIGRGIIKAGGQIFDYQRFKHPCIYKTAEVILGAFGSAYTDERNDARKAYNDNINSGRFNIDNKKDGRLDDYDREATSYFFTR
jgi:hypothetical protein